MTLLQRCSDEIMKEDRKKAFFHQDKVSVHITHIAVAKINELKFELLPHTFYSPDLTRLDYFLIPNLKKWVGGKRFASNEESEFTVDGYIVEFDGPYYDQGI